MRQLIINAQNSLKPKITKSLLSWRFYDNTPFYGTKLSYGGLFEARLLFSQLANNLITRICYPKGNLEVGELKFGGNGYFVGSRSYTFRGKPRPTSHRRAVVRAVFTGKFGTKRTLSMSTAQSVIANDAHTLFRSVRLCLLNKLANLI